ncbi:MAG: DUF2950 domain-containing protein [Armatimonadetes bacterium]|nr:DUF2950 domain-containing protein [Armatimonadota bacterium]
MKTLRMVTLLLLWCATPAMAAQQVFPTPDAAVVGLIQAVMSDGPNRMAQVLGPDAKAILQSGDKVADKNARLRFLNYARQRAFLVPVGKTRMMLQLGRSKWPFPIPIDKKGNSWYFNTPVGKNELLNRRVGRNELAAIQFCHQFVDAERAYAVIAGGGAYATRFLSTQGTRDGLYWPLTADGPASPLEEVVAAARKEGYTGQHGAPIHGYHVKILDAQGGNAPGGACSYLVDGKLKKGFALVAWPAKYRNSGVMTFVVNQLGIVYEKDLGKNSAAVAAAMTTYNPDNTWKVVP